MTCEVGAVSTVLNQIFSKQSASNFFMASSLHACATILNEQNVSFPLYLQRKECLTTVTYIRCISDPFHNYVHFVLLLCAEKYNG